MLVVSFTTDSEAMEFFHGKIFTTDKTEKTLLSLFTAEAKRALGTIPNDYKNRDPLDFSKAEAGSFQLLECYLTELLLVLRRRAAGNTNAVKISETSRELTESATVRLITDYLSENLYTQLTLSDICTRFYIGKSQLCKLFGDYLRTSPIEYFQKLKIAEAKRLLLSGDCTITGVSDMLGYSSIHNFSRAFKAAVGVSPTEYMRKITH